MNAFRALKADWLAIRRNDPAARGLEPLLYPSWHAICAHRLLSHPLYRCGLRFFGRFFSQIARFLTGMEIHPGARIAEGFFCDHGMAVVIGETAVIGRNCVMFHGVTLGGTGKHEAKRHPTVGHDVFLGTHATLLGPITVGDRARIGAETVIINRDVPADCTVVGTPGRIVRQNGRRVDPPAGLPVSQYRLDERNRENRAENGQDDEN